jgi:hypothetical protein
LLKMISMMPTSYGFSKKKKVATGSAVNTSECYSIL